MFEKLLENICNIAKSMCLPWPCTRIIWLRLEDRLKSIAKFQLRHALKLELWKLFCKINPFFVSQKYLFVDFFVLKKFQHYVPLIKMKVLFSSFKGLQLLQHNVLMRNVNLSKTPDVWWRKPETSVGRENYIC